MSEFRDVLDEAFSKNEEKIKALFPQTWTHFGNIDMLPIHYQLKLMGFDYRTDKELASLYAALETKKLILRDGLLVKRNPHKVY